ncbi:MAG: SulP family inorganic anion transporter [Flavobacteriales bacterium]|nr:SulP family inorganic anion transporter [Flavobacteriales bacterium]
MTDKNIPLSGIAGLKQNWQKDLVSGFIVFLVALPLCLGISLASGVPPMAGLITAIIGGLLVSRINGSHVTINGPAAGLIVVILGAVEALSDGDPMAGYRSMLAAVVVSGTLLFILGRLKAGRLGDFFPSSAVHGMLAAIGVIILSKQAHVALGVKPEGKEPLELLAEIPHSIAHMNPEVAIIGLVSLLIMFVLPLFKNRWVKMVPAPMVVVLAGIALGHYFDLEHEHKYLFLDGHEYSIGPKFLVTLPENLADGIVFPDWSKALTLPFLTAVITITLVQGIESLLSAKAVDKLDPWKRESDLNKDLSAVGAGSALAGLIGGLPMIAEIVRSSANINNGGRTGWANFFHGAFLLVFIAAFPTLIHSIPLAALGAILMYTGYRLAAPGHFKHTLQIGPEQLSIFTTTLIVTLATDLIIGVFSGILLKILIHLTRGASFRSLFKPNLHLRYDHMSDCFVLEVHDAAIFSNFLGLKKKLDSIPAQAHVRVDFDKATLVDHTVMEHVYSYKEKYERAGGHFEVTEMGHLVPRSQHPHAARHKSKKSKSAVSL